MSGSNSQGSGHVQMLSGSDGQIECERSWGSPKAGQIL